MRRYSRLLPLLIAAVVLLIATVPACSFNTVESGYRGIVFRSLSGGTSREILGEGLHILAPWNSVIYYDTRVQEMKEELTVISSNGKLNTIPR